MSVSLLLGSPEPESAFYMAVTRTERRAWIALLPCWKCCLPNVPQVLLPFLGCRGTALAHLQFVVHRVPQVLFWKTALVLQLRMYWSREFFLPRCSTWHLPLFDYIKFLFPHCSSLLRSLWTAAQPSGLSDPLPNFAKEQRDCTDLSLKSSR